MTRQFRRAQWRDSQRSRGSFMRALGQFARARLAGRLAAEPKFVDYHDHVVALGLRAKDFQCRKKFRRATLGLSATSTCMHRAYGHPI